MSVRLSHLRSAERTSNKKLSSIPRTPYVLNCSMKAIIEFPACVSNFNCDLFDRMTMLSIEVIYDLQCISVLSVP